MDQDPLPNPTRRPTSSRFFLRLRPAFTLLEVLVVLAVIGALAVGVTLSIRSTSSGADLRRASEDLQVFIASAKGRAAVSNTPMVVTFEPGERSVRLRRIAGESSPLTHELPAGVAVEGVRDEARTHRDRPLKVMIQPSGYLRQFAVRLRRDERRLWVLWNPAERPGWTTKAPGEVVW